MIIKNERKDLNIFHILARGGMLKDGDFSLYPIHFLYQLNKNQWLPIHLSKNKKTAELFFNHMKFQNYEIKQKILYEGLCNNAESTQTQYGINLYHVFLNYGFDTKISHKSSLEPTDKERLELSYFWISQFDWENTLYDVSIIFQKAIENSNSYFFFAFLKHSYFQKIPIKISQDLIIGKKFFISENVYQIYQIFKQNFDIKMKMQSFHYKNQQILFNENYFKNLEGS